MSISTILSFSSPFVKIVQQNSLYLLLLMALFMSSNLSAQMVERGPYIQSTTPSSSVIRWKTEVATDSKIWYGDAPGNLTLILTDTTTEQSHEMLISGLAPNTKYFYAIGNAAGIMEGDTADYYFKTHPIIGSKEKFHAWVMGDPGTGYQDQREVRDLYYSMEPGGETPLMITLGDNAYEDGEFQEFDDFFFDIYRDIFRRTTLWALPGNHDYHACDEDNEIGPFFDLFTNPQNGESGGAPSASQRYYSFDYANVHFIVVEGYEQPGQEDWLAEDLAQNTQDWTIALAHHPPYSDGNHDSDNNGTMSYVREVLVPMLEAAGVDLFMAGHSHVYERSFLIHGHYGESDELADSMIVDGGSGKMDVDSAYQKTMIGPNANKGTVYLVSGTSGGKSPDGDLDHPIMYEDHKKEGHGVLEVNNDTLHYTFYQKNGVIRDYFTIVKELLPEVDVDNDNYNADVDCDDNNPLVNPGATEIPNNNVDEDCDGIAQMDEDLDGFYADVDCDDTDASVNPDATEIPNNDVDEDCDGVAQIIDADMDGFNSAVDCDDDNPLINSSVTEIPNNDVDEDCDGIAQIIDADNDGSNSDLDCDDTNPDIYPGATEIPDNGIDEDCDGADGDMIIDEDMDGYNIAEDCDDADASINPEAVEILNNDIDEDCDGYAAYDLDEDGFTDDVDCDDENPNINPSVFEIANNDVDENCDGIIIIIDIDMDGFHYGIDCDDMDPFVNPDAVEIINNDVDEDCDGYTAYDLDNDGFTDDVDCDDMDASINPDATEIINNTIDENCDNVVEVIDEDMDGFNSDEDCDDTNPAINEDATEIPNNGIDEDCDGEDLVIDEDNDSYNSDVDCDETNPDINPGATEIPNNDVDEDCDGIAQIIDEDMDGFNSDEDCDDNNPAINEDATEIANNGIDEDCDGEDLVTTLRKIENNIALDIYPNPATDFLMLNADLNGEYEICIYNVIGNKIISLKANTSLVKIDLSLLESGLYLIEVKEVNGNSRGGGKFAKM